MRVITESINNLRRNNILSLATILSIALILLIFNVLITVNSVTKRQITALSDKINLNIYLSTAAEEDQIKQLRDFVAEQDGVENVEIINQDAALKLVKSKYPESVSFIEEFKLKNPLPASLQIKTAELEDQNTILKAINASDYAGLVYRSGLKKEQNETITKVVNNLIKIRDFTFQILLWMIFTFIVAGSLITFNAIRTTLHTRRTEIQIMQFVGATFDRIMYPFIFEGMLIGALAFGVNLILLMLANGFIPFTDLSILANLPVLLLELIIAVGIGTLTSAYIVNKYLNTKEIFAD